MSKYLIYVDNNDNLENVLINSLYGKMNDVEIVCSSLEVTSVKSYLEKYNLDLQKYKIKQENEFLEEKINKDTTYILFNLNIEYINFTEKFIYYEKSVIIILDNKALNKLDYLKRNVEKNGSFKIYMNGSSDLNISDKEILERKRVICECNLREEFKDKDIICGSENIKKPVALLIGSATNNLFIGVPWWTSTSYYYLTNLKEAVKRGVNTTLYYGIGEDDQRKAKTDETIDYLKSVLQGYSNISFVQVASHAAFVIADNTLLNSSNNFTSSTNTNWFEMANIQYNQEQSKLDEFIGKIQGRCKNDYKNLSNNNRV